MLRPHDSPVCIFVKGCKILEHSNSLVLLLLPPLCALDAVHKESDSNLFKIITQYPFRVLLFQTATDDPWTKNKEKNKTVS